MSIQDRKARTRRLIEAGALVEMAGLLDADPMTLLGGLVAFRKLLAGNLEQAAAYRRAGVSFQADRERAKAAGSDGSDIADIAISYLVAPPEEVRAKLKAAGLEWRDARMWEGRMQPDSARLLAQGTGGMITIRRKR